jgi:hypothetical protein
MANDIYYEPHPFTEIEKHINLELKLIITDITRNQGKSIT